MGEVRLAACPPAQCVRSKYLEQYSRFAELHVGRAQAIPIANHIIASVAPQPKVPTIRIVHRSVVIAASSSRVVRANIMVRTGRVTSAASGSDSNTNLGVNGNATARARFELRFKLKAFSPGFCDGWIGDAFAGKTSSSFLYSKWPAILALQRWA